MGFPIDPEDGDEYVNALGTKYKYQLADHKWYIMSVSAGDFKLDDLQTPDDNTDLNSTTTEHGLLKKLDNVATNYMNGQGNWAEPAGAGGGESLVWRTPEASAIDFAIGSGLTADTAWHELDVSAIVPANASMAYVKLQIRSNSTDVYIQLRDTTQTNVFQVVMFRTQVANLYNYGCFWIPMDSNRKVDYMISSVMNACSIVILGWSI